MTNTKKIAVVTGAGGGIGTEITNQLVDKGFFVYASDLSLEGMAHLDGDSIKKLIIDVTDESTIQAAIQSIHEVENRIDLLVNNAGYAQLGMVECVPIEAVERSFNVNVFGYGRMQRAVIPIMRKQRSGRIINISSVVGKIPMPGFGWYSATKHAVEAMTDSLREEVSMFGIHVSMVEPGLVATPFIDRQRAGLGAVEHPPEYEKIVTAVDNVGADGSGARPEQIAGAVVKIAASNKPIRRRALPMDAKGLFFIRRWLGDGVLFSFFRSAMKLPKSI